MLVTLSNPLNLAVVGNPPRHRRKHMARTRHRSRHRRHRTSSHVKRLRHRGHRIARKRGMWSRVRTTRSGAVKHVRRKHSRKLGRWSGKKGTITFYKGRRKIGTNPRRRRGRSGRFMRRFNPGGMVGGIMGKANDYILSPIESLPKGLPALLKGNLVKHAGFAVAGSIAAMVGGNMLQKFTLPLIAKVLPASAGVMSGGITQRVLGASFALLSGSLIGRFGLKDIDARNAFVTGAAASALVEAFFPGKMGSLLGKLPLIGGWIAPAASPVQGIAGLFGTDSLGAYVQAPGYQGVGAYVQAPGYQGVGAYVQAPGYQGVGRLGTYVSAPSYEGSVAGFAPMLPGMSGPGDEAVAGLGYAGEQLAGNLEGMGSNMMSHLDA